MSVTVVLEPDACRCAGGVAEVDTPDEPRHARRQQYVRRDKASAIEACPGLRELKYEARGDRQSGRPAAEADLVQLRLARVVDVGDSEEEALGFPFHYESCVELEGMEEKRLHRQAVARRGNELQLLAVLHGDQHRSVGTNGHVLEEEMLGEFGDDGELGLGAVGIVLNLS